MYVVPFADLPWAGSDAPLETIELVATCFRFAKEGDVAAGGNEGGVRVPLAVILELKGAVAMRERCRRASSVERAQGGRRSR